MLITVELSSEQGFNGILQGNVINESTADGYSWQKANEGNSFGSTEHEGKQKAAFIWDVKPSGNELNVSLWWMADGSAGVDIDSITVIKKTQETEAPIYTFTATGDYTVEFQKYFKEYQAGDEITVTAELSSEKGFNGILQGNVVDETAMDGYSWQKANSGNSFGSEERDGKQRATFTWTVKPSGTDLNISLWWMADDSAGVDIDSITVKKTDATEALLSLNYSSDVRSESKTKSADETSKPSAEELPKADAPGVPDSSVSAPAPEEEADANAECSDAAASGKEDAVLPEEEAETPTADEAESEGEEETAEKITDRIKEEEGSKEENASEEETSGQEEVESSDSEKESKRLL